MLLRARTVLPISAPPIDDGAVIVIDGSIREVGRWRDVQKQHSGEVVDLGDVVLLPGLINAHCHLDYTDMAGLLAPTRHFSDWVKAIVGVKAEWSYTEFARSWLNGAGQLLRSGATTVVDIEAVPELMPDVLANARLRVITCLELISVRSRASAAELVSAAENQLREAQVKFPGLSPHAPYTTSGDLLRRSADAARRNGWFITTHVAESEDEFNMFRHARGPMFDWLKNQRDVSECDGRTPVEHLAVNHVLGPNCLAVHVNYLGDADAALLARSGTSVVHCPQSHAYFGHQKFPFETLRKAGVNICLGTDSLASTRAPTRKGTLSLFDEMQQFARVFPNVPPEEIVRMATRDAAHALRQDHQLGGIEPGRIADLIAVPASQPGDAYASVLACNGDVTASMIGGQWAIPPT